MAYEDIYANFKRHFPLIAAGVAHADMDGVDCLILETVAMERFIYDDSAQTIRALPDVGVPLDKKEFAREFGRRLRKMLDRRRMYQSELADALGVSQVTVSNYITGTYLPDFYTISKIAAALRCSVDDLCYLG